ncbi:MAG: hypothetical protein ACR5LG_15100 [Sodalis sp. (in: enterobacteria)]|uniref:hypothetical protein n=1 Tax=Sodalis sp. (in: enterobacteria) TaxID=1898979 RepID=UPI003F36BDDA
MISMVKSTSLASIITLMEITGIAAGIIAETYRALEVFLVAGALYLAINLILTRLLLQWLEYRLMPHFAAATEPVLREKYASCLLRVARHDFISPRRYFRWQF